MVARGQSVTRAPGPDLHEYVCAKSGFRDECDGTRRGDSSGELLGVISRKEQYRDPGISRPDAAACLESIDAGQMDVHQNEVRMQPARSHNRFLAGLDLAHDLESVRSI